MLRSAFKLLRVTAFLVGGIAAVALVVVAAVGSAFLAVALTLRNAAGTPRRRAQSRTTSTRTAPRPRPAHGA